MLTDNNFSCTDSINTAGSLVVTTDLEGRFSVTFLGGPAFFATTPCQPGKFTITAALQVLPSIFVMTSFKIQAPMVFTPAHQLSYNPNPATITTSGSFVSTLYGKGWTPGQAFTVSMVTSSCGTTTFTTPSAGSVDGDGNFAVGVSGTGCSAGTVRLLVVVGTSSRLITLHLAAPSL